MKPRDDVRCGGLNWIYPCPLSHPTCIWTFEFFDTLEKIETTAQSILFLQNRFKNLFSTWHWGSRPKAGVVLVLLEKFITFGVSSFWVLTSSHVSYDVTSWGGAGQYMSQNQKSEIFRLKKIQITSNLDTSRKIVRQTFPESLTKIWQADVTWRHFMTSYEEGGQFCPPRPTFNKIQKNFLRYVQMIGFFQ